MKRELQGLAAVACALWVSAASAAPSVVEVRLSVKEPARVEVVGEVQAGGVLRLRPTKPGRLEVRVGERLLMDCYIGWYEDDRLRLVPVEGGPEALPRVVGEEREGQPWGAQEVEVALPQEVESLGEWVALSYVWLYEKKPAIERRWRLVAGAAQEWQQGAVAEDFEEEFALWEEPLAEGDPAAEETREEEEDLVEAEELLRAQMDAQEPEVWRVWPYASRAQVTEQLFGDASAVGGFDYERCEVPGESTGLSACVRVRQVAALRPALHAEVRRALEALLKAEEALLRDWEPSEQYNLLLAERSLVWAQRAEMRDEQGRSYFDRYLVLLADKRVAGDWDILGSHSEQLKKVVALRARQWKTNYQVEDGTPRLRPGDVVGRCYYSRSLPERRFSVAVRVRELLLEDASQGGAELRLRNGRWQGLRVLVPGKDGLWRGYAAELVSVEEDARLEEAGTRLYGYYPGTLFLRPEERRVGVPGRGDEEEGLRRQVLAVALEVAIAKKPHALLGLDHEVLELLTREQRLRLVELLVSNEALGSQVVQEVVELLARVVLTTPEEDFVALGRVLVRQEVLNRLLRLQGPQQALLGQAWTFKALTAAPLKLEDVAELPHFQLGKQGEQTHLLNVPVEQTPGGETLVRFRPVHLRFSARYFPAPEEDPTSRGLQARDWVRVDLYGDQPETRLMTALELGLLAPTGGSELLWSAVGRLSELYMLYGGVAALGQAPLVGAAAVEGSAAAAARRAAVKTFAGRVALVAVMATVDTYREELSRTEAGRDFLLVHDLVLLGLAARDVSKLLTSGVLQEWARRAAAALSRLGDKASAGLRESLESAQALGRAVERVLAESKVAATQQGLTFSTPEGTRALRHAWLSIRGELAAQRALAGLQKAGVATPEVERTLNALRSLGEQSEDWARAWSAAARRVVKLPPQEVRQPPEAVESLRAAARPAAQTAVAVLLRSSASRAPSQALNFLKDAEWLVQRPGLEEEALTVLARKAGDSRVDLRWLGSTALTVEDLNFLGKDVRTPWGVFKRAAEQPGNLKLQLRARRLLRGIAGELVTQRSAQALFPDYKIVERQVLLEGGHIIDFELQALRAFAGIMRRKALEVKGWTADTWSQALQAWTDARAGANLGPRQQQLLRQLEAILEQLKDAARPPRDKPFLVCTDKLSPRTRGDLQKFLLDNSVKAEIRTISELEMIRTTRRLRAALNLAERLPIKERGGRP
jgi:hypothetical protein